jgi:EmrB/QacA subfamily drug resistance transporter
MSTHTITSPSPPPHSGLLARIKASPWAALPVVLTGTFMVILDFFIVNVALPSMQAKLHAGSQTIEWVAAGYGLTSAICLITAGRLGDRFGRRRVFATGLALFTLSSALCGFAPNSTVLVAGRLLQGVAGALIMTNTLSLLSVLYQGADRARALSAYGVVMGLAAAGGQLIGGALMQWDPAGADWRSCFLINLPIGVLGLLATRRLVPESRAPRAPRTDVAGTVLLTGGLVAIVLPLVQGRALDWPMWTWLSLAAAPVLLGTFLIHQRARDRRGGEPLLVLSLFRERAFGAGVVVQLAFWSGQASFFLVLALYLQQGRGLSALHSGLVFTVLAVTYLVASAKAAELVERHGRRVLAAGATVLAAGHATLLAAVAVVGTGGSVLVLVPGLLLIGAGMGLGIAPLATIVLAAVPEEHAGAASGTLTTMQNVGNALGVAIIGVVYFGAVHAGAAPAFEWSLGVLAVILIGVAGLSRLLPEQAS